MLSPQNKTALLALPTPPLRYSKIQTESRMDPSATFLAAQELADITSSASTLPLLTPDVTVSKDTDP